jgi:MFS family permease
VKIDRSASSSGVPLGTLIVLMLAVLTVSVGFGVVLPLLPGLIASLSTITGSDRSIASNTGLLTSTYVLALFLFAPLWGRASDRQGRRTILVVGMIGFAASMLMSSFVSSLSGL